MKHLSASAVTRRRWVFLSAMLLAAATFGALYIAVLQAQEANGAITGLRLSSETPGTLAVSWDTASPTPTDYRVNWAKSGESYPSWTSEAGNRYPAGTSLELTGLDQGAEYEVRVRARYYKGTHADSPWSGPWEEASLQVAGNIQPDTATPTPEPTPVPSPTPVPGALGEVTAIDDGSGGLVISWQAPAAPHDQPTDYRLNWAGSTDEYPSYTQEDANAHPTAATHTLAGLEGGAEYKVRVRARYYQGSDADSPWGGPWAEARARVMSQPPEVPSAATAPNLLATALTPEGHVTLLWQDPSDDSITGYQVLRGPDADSLVVIEQDTGSGGTSYTDTAPPAGQTHTYAVKARNAAGLSPVSNTRTATVPPAAPNLVGTAVTPAGQVLLSWQNPSDDSITGYQVLRGSDADSLAVIEEDTGSSGTSYTDTAPPAGQTHTYAVKARNAAGLSPRSNTRTATVPPSAPTGLTALPTHGSVMLSWDDPDHGGITGYKVLRGPDAGSLEVVAMDTGSVSPWYVDTGLSEDTSYVYAVKALGAGGQSAPSDVAETSTLQAATTTVVEPPEEEEPPVAQQQQEGDPPPAPYHLRLFATHDRVTLAWSYLCCGNITGFRILRGPSEDALEVLVADTDSRTPWYVDSAVEAGTGYVYAIKSLNGNGESPGSASRSVTTPPVPGDNTLLSNMGNGMTGAPVGDAAFVGSGKAAQAFTTGDNAQGYDLEGVWVDVFRGDDAPIDPKVSLYATTGFRPSTLVYELTPPERDHTLPDTDTQHVRSHEYREGPEYYSAPAGATLSANTRYLVVFEQGTATDQAYSSSYYTMNNVTGEANSGAASGWSIGYSIYIGSRTVIFSTQRQIAILGTAR